MRSVLFDLGANIYSTSLQYLICSYRNQANGPSPCRNHGGRGRDGRNGSAGWRGERANEARVAHGARRSALLALALGSAARCMLCVARRMPRSGFDALRVASCAAMRSHELSLESALRPVGVACCMLRAVCYMLHVLHAARCLPHATFCIFARCTFFVAFCTVASLHVAHVLCCIFACCTWSRAGHRV